MADFIELQADFEDVYDQLDELGKKRRQIVRYVLSNVTRLTKNKIKKDYNLYLHKKSGNLYKHIKSKLYRNLDWSYIISDARGSNNVGYPFVLAAGAEIKPKKEDGCLTFQIDGKWIRKKSVTIPARDYINAPAKKYLGSSEMKKDMDFYLQKKLDALESKGVITRITTE